MNGGGGEDEFLSDVDRMLDEKKTKFGHIIPLQPFNIMVCICKHDINIFRRLRGEWREEEEEEEKKGRRRERESN